MRAFRHPQSRSQAATTPKKDAAAAQLAVKAPSQSMAGQEKPEGARQSSRAGIATVEFALVAPLLIMLALGMVEFGRMLMVQQSLTNAAREGARKAVLPGATDTQVNETIKSYMSTVGVSGHTNQISPSSDQAAAGTPIKVTLSVPYSNVSWLPPNSVRWLSGKSLVASVEMRKEEY